MAVLLSVVGILLPPAAATGLELDRTRAFHGEIWRMLTCHWAHYSFSHFLWSFIPFVFLAVLCERDSRGRFLACLAGAALIVPLAVWVAAPSISTYRGLSGLDSALFTLLAATVAREKARERSWGWVAAAALVVLAFAGKLLFEATTARGFFLDTHASGMTPVPVAHLAGALVGLASGLWPWKRGGGEAKALEVNPSETNSPGNRVATA
ncbi:MAG: rhombosortase [Planctomycetes bacterium]|nr:rhombosortase [Planctomycetota bacterium]